MNKALVINTHSSNEDCLKMFFGQFNYFGFSNFFTSIYVFADKKIDIPCYAKLILYDEKDTFCKQMKKCLSQVKESVMLYVNEDYILYGEPQQDILWDMCKKLKPDSDISYIRLVYCDMMRRMDNSDFHPIHYSSENVFSQTASFWKTKDFKKIHNVDVPYSIGVKGESCGHFELYANKICFDLKISGLVYYTGEEKKVGIYHYDSLVLPHIATAITKGKWNILEYNFLDDMLKKYGIDKNLRGCVC